MCGFPSWIEKGKIRKEILFLTDKDIDDWDNLNDKIGHQAIRDFFHMKLSHGTAKEGFPCHPQVAAAIRNGEMLRIMGKLGADYEVDRKGHLTFAKFIHPKNKEIVFCQIFHKSKIESSYFCALPENLEAK